jgi:hypothetical protein
MIDPDIPEDLRLVAEEVERSAKTLGLGHKVEIYRKADNCIQIRYIKQTEAAKATRVYIRPPADETAAGPDGKYLVWVDRGFDQYAWPREAAQEALVMLMRRIIEEGQPEHYLS